MRGDQRIREGRWVGFIERLKRGNEPKSTRSAGKRDPEISVDVAFHQHLPIRQAKTIYY